MSDETMPPDMPADDLMAAEYALGLLEGEELLTARGRLAREPDLPTLSHAGRTASHPCLTKSPAWSPAPNSGSG